jgi:hypothetical protein
MEKLQEEIFVLYLLANPPPPGILPVILLDAYQCHMMQLVVSVIAALGVEAIYIPGGCMGLCQPLEVGINKSFKHCCHLLWEDWMMNMIGTNGETREATCKEVSAWTAEVFWDMMGKKLLKNARQKMGYEWFEGVVEEEGMDGDGNEDDDDKAHDNCNNDNEDKAHDEGGDNVVLSNGDMDNEEWEDWEEDGA